MPVEGKAVAFLTSSEGIEQAELTGPWDAVKQAGGRPVLIATTDGKVQAFHHLDRGDTFQVDQPVRTADAGEFAAVVVPGGVANGDQLRVDPDAQRFLKAFFDAGKPVAVICHGGWILAEIGVLSGRTLTSWPTLQTDLRNAGGTWVDREVVVDVNGAGPLITSRKPDDLPAFTRELLAAI
jgi:protease I